MREWQNKVNPNNIFEITFSSSMCDQQIPAIYLLNNGFHCMVKYSGRNILSL